MDFAARAGRAALGSRAAASECQALGEDAWSGLRKGTVKCRRILSGRARLQLAFEFTETAPRPSSGDWQKLVPLLDGLERGASNLQLSHEHSLSEATVSRRVHRLLRQVNLPRTTLPLLRRCLPEVPRAALAGACIRVQLASPASFTDGEWDVVYWTLLGFDPARIGVLRSTSPATVRKQLRRAAAKAGCVDRLELGACEALEIALTRAPEP